MMDFTRLVGSSDVMLDEICNVYGGGSGSPRLSINSAGSSLHLVIIINL